MKNLRKITRSENTLIFKGIVNKEAIKELDDMISSNTKEIKLSMPALIVETFSSEHLYNNYSKKDYRLLVDDYLKSNESNPWIFGTIKKSSFTKKNSNEYWYARGWYNLNPNHMKTSENYEKCYNLFILYKGKIFRLSIDKSNTFAYAATKFTHTDFINIAFNIYCYDENINVNDLF